MVEHTQTIRRKQPTNCLRVFDHFVGLSFKGLIERSKWYEIGKSSRFYEALGRFNTLFNRESFDTIAVDIYYHNSEAVLRKRCS